MFDICFFNSELPKCSQNHPEALESVIGTPEEVLQEEYNWETGYWV